LEALLVSTGKAASDSEYDDDGSDSHHLDEDFNDGASSATAAQVEAAAVHVQAGHFDDTIPGLAHFHERTLVMIGVDVLKQYLFLPQPTYTIAFHLSQCT
jgi:hypothetical protein